MRQFLQFIRAYWPDVWREFQLFLKFFRNFILWFFILMLSGIVATWIMPHSFNQNPGWLTILILIPLRDLAWILYMIVSLFWVFKPRITEENAFMLGVFYGIFERMFNFRSWKNFLRGVLIMAVILLSVKWIGGYLMPRFEVESIKEELYFTEVEN